MRIFEFANKIKKNNEEFQTEMIILLLSNVSYRINDNDYLVLPMNAILYDGIRNKEFDVSFQEMIDICDRIPYLNVRTNKRRKVLKQFMEMTIHIDEKEYGGFLKIYNYDIQPWIGNTESADKMKESVYENIMYYQEHIPVYNSIGCDLDSK